MIFDDMELPSHKTKYIVNYANQMENAKKLLLVDGGPINEKLKLATQNLHYVNVLPSIVCFKNISFFFFNKYVSSQLPFFLVLNGLIYCLQGLNVYSILLHDTLIMSRDAVNRIVERMHTPINR